MKLPRHSSCIVLSLVLGFLVGCASVGNNFDDSKISQIKKGETTEADLLKSFGEPQNRMINADGQVTLTWIYSETAVKGETFIPYAGAFMGGARSKTKSLTVMLAEGKVTNYTYSGGGTESRNMTQAQPKQ